MNGTVQYILKQVRGSSQKWKCSNKYQTHSAAITASNKQHSICEGQIQNQGMSNTLATPSKRFHGNFKWNIYNNNTVSKRRKVPPQPYQNMT
jgi:hypothetical protein